MGIEEAGNDRIIHFGAEFVAMKFGIEKLRGLRYKLRMMGVPIDGPSLVYGDNLSVIKNSQTPES